MKRWKRVLLGIVALMMMVVVALCIWQRSNIKALYTFLTLDSQTIAGNLEQRRMDHQRALEEDIHLTVLPPTTVQSDALLSGQTTPEEVKETLGITAQMEQEKDEQTEEELINRCVAELYACKVDLMAELGGMKQAAVDQWLALPPEQQTETAMRELGLAGLEDCYNLEVVIDAQVQDILDRYRPLLVDAGGDTSILEKLWNYYEAEKTDEKAYYMDKYLR